MPEATTARAALIPLDALAGMGLTREITELPAVLVSLVESAPTHVLCVADRLSPEAAARILAAPRALLLYGRPNQALLAEDPAAAAEAGRGDAGALTILLRDCRSPLEVQDVSFRPLGSLVRGAWAGTIRAAATRAWEGGAELRLELAASERREPAEACLLQTPRLGDLDDRLDRLPPDEFDGIQFSLWAEGAFLLGPPGRELPSFGGISFWRVGGTGDGALFVGLGREPSPALALPLLLRALGAKPGHVLFWLPTPVVVQVPWQSLTPLDRRAWREARGWQARRGTANAGAGAGVTGR
ncbi:MAG: hypothetical protein HYZ53_20270 [Planctomycetes bacterium]|nr:hypothetical protein [Planctomycetota bacterium]